MAGNNLGAESEERQTDGRVYDAEQGEQEKFMAGYRQWLTKWPAHKPAHKC